MAEPHRRSNWMMVKVMFSLEPNSRRPPPATYTEVFGLFPIFTVGKGGTVAVYEQEKNKTKSQFVL